MMGTQHWEVKSDGCVRLKCSPKPPLRQDVLGVGQTRDPRCGSFHVLSLGSLH